MIESLGSFEGKYEILERIGEGGMGAVYKVRHRLMNDIRVIKTMRAHLADRTESRERFFREARIAARVKHENIAQVLDFSMDEETAFLVMEFIDGVTLQEILATHGPPSIPLALEIAQQSLRALAVVHRTGIIHRDISPDNLMLTTDSDGNPKVKLIDLGLAKLTGADSGLTKEGFFLGKLRYASPEHFQSQEDAAIGTWSDVYSFGLVLYEFVTGRYPVRGRDMAGLMAGHVSSPPMPFSESDPEGRVPNDLRRAILRSLEKRPENRFPTGESFHDQVRLIQVNYPIGQSEKEESIRLNRRLPAETREHDASSNQSRIDGVFRADKSSAGGSHSEDVTESVDTQRTRLSDTLQARERRTEDTVGGQGSLPSAAARGEADETVIRPSDHGPSDVADERRGVVPARQQAPKRHELTPPLPKIISEQVSPRGETSTARVAPSPMRAKWLWLTTAAALVIVATTLIVKMTGMSIPSWFDGDINNTAGAGMAGTLVLNANPWAEVVNITNASGDTVQLNGSRYTPLVLSLAPGVYEIVVKNDDYGQKTVETEISADHTTTETVALATISEEDLLRALGVME